MNIQLNPMIRAQQEHSLPLCGGVPAGSASVQDFPARCPPSAGGFDGPPSRVDPSMLHHRSANHHNNNKQHLHQREMSPEEQQELRRKINSRERRRMQDLNVAMDALREVMVPYGGGGGGSSSSSPSPLASSSSSSSSSSSPPGRRLSKISTLVLARNYILLLGSSLQEMRRLLGEVSVGMGMGMGMGVGSGVNPMPRLLLHAAGGGWPLISAAPGHHHQLLLSSPESLLASAAASSSSSTSSSSTSSKCPLLSPPMEAQWGSSAGVPLCPCGVCRLPRFGHGSSPGPSRFPK